MSTNKYAIGVDFGTESGRAVLVEVAKGQEIATAVHQYANGVSSTVTGPAMAYADVREDRVVIYASASSSVQTYSYRIRATNAGEFVVPPAWAQGLYERERQARSLAGKVVVGVK